jgi:nucleoside phosphorylase
LAGKVHKVFGGNRAMMKVLVIHDRDEVMEEVKRIVCMAVPDAAIDLAEDGVGARRHLGKTVYDLVIIDLTLPHIKGRGHAEYHVADNLLQELFSLETLHIPADVIGLTKDTEALDIIRTSIGSHLMITIQESEDGRWRDLLAQKISYASKVAVSRHVSINQNYHYDALIVTALDEEFRPYRERLDLWPSRHFIGAFEFVFNDRDRRPRKGIAYPIGKSGQARAASVTQSLVSFFRPRLALMSGFCGGIIGKTKLGDLVIFDIAYDWDYGKWTKETNEPGPKEPPVSVFWSRPHPISIDGHAAHRIARDLIESNFSRQPALLSEVGRRSKGKLQALDAYIAPVASGSAVVADESVIGHIRGLNESIRAVDMEAFGFYHACSQTQVVRPAFVCMKSIADFCNSDKGDELHEACCGIAAAAVMDIMVGRWVY